MMRPDYNKRKNGLQGHRARLGAKTVKFNSDACFKRIAEDPGLVNYLSVADRLIVCFGGVNYRIEE